MDIAGQHLLGVGQDGTGVVGQDDFHLCAAVPDEVAVVLDVVHAGEGVLVLAKEFPIPLQGQHVAVGVDARFVQLIQGHQAVAHFVAGVAEHEDDLVRTLSDAPQADGKAVAGEDGQDDADGAGAELGTHVGGDVVHGGVVALRAGHHGLGDRDDVLIPQLEALLFGRFQHTGDYDIGQVVPLADDRAANAPRYSTNFPFHK